MFRRLAEALQVQPQGRQGQQDGFQGSHQDYIQEQDKYFKTLPNLIPAVTSGLSGFDKAIQSADTLQTDQYQKNPVEFPNDIFRAVPSPGLAEQAAYCAASGLDALIATQNPKEPVGCGWLYTPPPLNSPYPGVSRGALGKADGPVKAFGPPSHRQWFFDLQAAKRQVLLDKCKALKECKDVDSEVFKGCGFCKNTNQGVPIDQTGQPLYPSDPRGGCDAESIVRSAGQCPPPPPPDAGPPPMVDRTCDPMGGRLGAECMRRQILAAGCKEQGAIAMALANPQPGHYLNALNRYDAVGLYQRQAQPPMNMELFREGRATIQQVLDEGRRLVENTQKPESSGLGLAARDLCLRRGAFQAYDPCSELSDGSTAPFDLRCLQSLFLKMGGQPAGKKYPSAANHAEYNALGTWGAVKQYLQGLYRGMYVNTTSGPLKEPFQGGSGAGAYDTQRQAMMDLLGIVPEKSIERVPYRQGVEVFWLVPGEPRWGEGKPCQIHGILRRTIERDIVQLQPGRSGVAQIGGGPCAAMLQLTDIRAQEAASVKFQVNIDDGFWITVNQPNSVSEKAMNQVNADEPGFFENNWYQGPTWYGSQACTPFSPSTPNITKLFYQDSGCGGQSFVVNTTSCSGTNPFQKPLYSLTLEQRAPFLAFEVNRNTGKFEENRLGGIIEKLVYQRGVTPYVRTDDRQTVPGKRAFLRMNSMKSCVDIHNVAYQGWKTISFAIRFQTMPVKETLIGFAMGQQGTLYYNIIATTSGGNNISISVEHFFGGSDKVQSFTSGLQLNKWYLFFIHNNGNGFTLYCDDMERTVRLKKSGGNIGSLTLTHTGPLYGTNATWWPKSGSGQPFEVCTITVGTDGFVGNWKSYYASSACEYDLAWVHFFDYHTLYAEDDLYRECMGDWKYTQFPVAYQTFRGKVED